MCKSGLSLTVLVVLIFALFLSPWAYADNQNRSKRPNIILILTDDQPYGYMGVTGNKVVNTPNLDKLAEQGVLFTNAHVSSAICTPSRVSLLLGQYERKHGVNFNSGTAVSEQAWNHSYPQLFKQSGYYTGWIGKNHTPVGERGYQTGLMEQSFDYWYAGHGHIWFYPKHRHDIFSEATADTQAEIIGEGVNDFLNSNEFKFKKAKTFLSRRPADKPFMLSINFNLPHGAGTSSMKMREQDPALYKTAYRDTDIPLPKHYIAKQDIVTPKLPVDLLRAEDRQEIYDVVNTPKTMKERYIRQMQAMTGIDKLVGELREELHRQGLAENTVIMFTSDHGLFMGEFGLGGKALCYEKTTHVPLIVYDPRNKANQRRSNDLVQNIDIAPTMLSIASIAVPASMQGEDISGVIGQTSEMQRRYVFSENLWSTHFGNPRCDAIQDERWKYVRYYQNNNMSASYKVEIAEQMGIDVNKILYGVHDSDIASYRSYLEAPLQGELPVYEELFDLQSDPDETTNLARLNEHQQRLQALRVEWQQVMKKAIGEGKPAVVRFTQDSIREQGVKAKLY